MDVLTQALKVVASAEAATGRVVLTLDLDHPVQRAAYAAAVAVLHVQGIDSEALLSSRSVSDDPAVVVGRPTVVAHVAGAAGDAGEAGDADDEASESESEASKAQDAQLRREYAGALSELTAEEPRQEAVLKETFPRVRDLLRHGANMEAVAQLQYRRWVEEHLDDLRGN